MKKLITILSLLIMCSCHFNDKTMINRSVFDAKGLHFITSFSNRKQQTMSVLYGNDVVRKSTLLHHHERDTVTIYTLVTYQQANSKNWYGAHINGAVMSIETITAATNASNHFQYKLEQGVAPADSLGLNQSEEDRIRFILSRKPSFFP